MFRNVTTAAALLVGLLVTTCQVIASDFWTEEELRNSSWNSVYTTANGKRVHAQLKFNDGDGTYETSFGKGQLSNLEYGIDSTSADQPFFQITGNWSFQGESGQFLLASNGRDKFKGSWQGEIGSGKWNGMAMYGEWQEDADNDRMFCEYRYPSKDNPAEINVQIMIWYPNDPARTGYYYFANKKNKIWGRCVCPSNPNYDPEVMQWSKLTDGAWEELPQGDCPAPKDGDPMRAAIDKIPDPPA